jgi:hypothetical protein
MFSLGAPAQEMVQHVQVLVQELQALFFFELFFALLFSLFFSAVMLSFLLLLCDSGFHSADQGDARNPSLLNFSLRFGLSPLEYLASPEWSSKKDNSEGYAAQLVKKRKTLCTGVVIPSCIFKWSKHTVQKGSRQPFSIVSCCHDYML